MNKNRMTKAERKFVLDNYDAFKSGLLSTVDSDRYLNLCLTKTF